MAGFVKIHRDILTHWIYQREDYLKAWIWLIMTARYKTEPDTKLIKGQLVEIKRGQLIGSVRFLQKAWRWRSITKVETFLNLLENEKMIVRDFAQNIGRITICKYASYQESKDEQRTVKGQTKDSERTVKGQNRKKGERREKEGRKKGEEENADNYVIWRDKILNDDMFLSATAMSLKVKITELPQLVDNFIQMKKGLSAANHKNYKDFKMNFFYWLPNAMKRANQPNGTSNSKSVGEKYNYEQYGN